MTISQVLEVAIGLIFVYYVLGSIVSLITQWINEALETRGTALEKYLIELVGKDEQNTHLNRLVGLPQIQALQPIRYKNWWSVFTAATEPKKVEKIPTAVLVDAYFDIAGLTKRDLGLPEIKQAVSMLPESNGKKAMLQWLEQGIDSVEGLRSRASTYFNGIMDQAAAKFRSNARSFVIMLSIATTLVFGTDSIQLARGLWTNAELRAIAAAKAEMVVAQEGANASLDDLINQLGDLSIKIGWWNTERPDTTATTAEWASFLALKALGLGLTAVAVSQGSSFWYDILKKLVGTSKGKSGGDAEAKG